MIVCNVDGCIRHSYARGLCTLHYMRAYRGKPIGPAQPYKQRTLGGRSCSLPDCDRLHHARGYCAMHYRIQQRAGAFS